MATLRMIENQQGKQKLFQIPHINTQHTRNMPKIPKCIMWFTFTDGLDSYFNTKTLLSLTVCGIF